MIFLDSMIRDKGLFSCSFELSFLKITAFSNFISSFLAYLNQLTYLENVVKKA
jgi:hypothetical protein